MQCDLCHKNPATVHLTEIINDKVTELHICQGCAQVKTQELKQQLSVPELLGGLIDIEGIRPKATALRCSTCKMTYSDFKKTGRLGCAQCYTTFKDNLLPLLRKIHGSINHQGKTPGVVGARKATSSASRLKELKERLARAIKMEEYEAAARLRDEIKKLENKTK